MPTDRSAAYTVKHSGWPFTEENLIGEFIELPRVEHEALLAELDYFRVRMMVAVSFIDSDTRHTFHEHVAELDAKHRDRLLAPASTGGTYGR